MITYYLYALTLKCIKKLILISDQFGVLKTLQRPEYHFFHPSSTKTNINSKKLFQLIQYYSYYNIVSLRSNAKMYLKVDSDQRSVWCFKNILASRSSLFSTNHRHNPKSNLNFFILLQDISILMISQFLYAIYLLCMKSL